MRRLSSSRSLTAVAAACLILGLVAGMSSCPTRPSTQEPTAGRSTATEGAVGLIPAVAQRPRAAGVCAGPTSDRLGVVAVNPDAPSPRCLALGRQQGLRVLNTTTDYGQPGRSVIARWGPCTSDRLEPGESFVFRQPAGRVFAPGLHILELDLGDFEWRVEILVDADPLADRSSP